MSNHTSKFVDQNNVYLRNGLKRSTLLTDLRMDGLTTQPTPGARTPRPLQATFPCPEIS